MATKPTEATSATEWTKKVGIPQLEEIIASMKQMGAPTAYMNNVCRAIIDNSYTLMLEQGWPVDECQKCKTAMELAAQKALAA